MDGILSERIVFKLKYRTTRIRCRRAFTFLILIEISRLERVSLELKIRQPCNSSVLKFKPCLTSLSLFRVMIATNDIYSSIIKKQDFKIMFDTHSLD